MWWHGWTLHQLVEVVFCVIKLSRVRVACAQLFCKVDGYRKFDLVAFLSGRANVFAKGLVVLSVCKVFLSILLVLLCVYCCCFPGVLVGVLVEDVEFDLFFFVSISFGSREDWLILLRFILLHLFGLGVSDVRCLRNLVPRLLGQLDDLSLTVIALRVPAIALV